MASLAQRWLRGWCVFFWGIVHLTYQNKDTHKDAAATDLAAGAPDVIDVTESMIDAGLCAYRYADRRFYSDEEIVAMVYSAMAKGEFVRPEQPGQRSGYRLIRSID